MHGKEPAFGFTERLLTLTVWIEVPADASQHVLRFQLSKQRLQIHLKNIGVYLARKLCKEIDAAKTTAYTIEAGDDNTSKKWMVFVLFKRARERWGRLFEGDAARHGEQGLVDVNAAEQNMCDSAGDNLGQVGSTCGKAGAGGRCGEKLAAPFVKCVADDAALVNSSEAGVSLFDLAACAAETAAALAFRCGRVECAASLPVTRQTWRRAAPIAARTNRSLSGEAVGARNDTCQGGCKGASSADAKWVTTVGSGKDVTVLQRTCFNECRTRVCPSRDFSSPQPQRWRRRAEMGCAGTDEARGRCDSGAVSAAVRIDRSGALVLHPDGSDGVAADAASLVPTGGVLVAQEGGDAAAAEPGSHGRSLPFDHEESGGVAAALDDSGALTYAARAQTETVGTSAPVCKGRASSGCGSSSSSSDSCDDDSGDEREYPLPGSRAECDGCGSDGRRFYHCVECGTGAHAFDLCVACHRRKYHVQEHHRTYPHHDLRLVTPRTAPISLATRAAATTPARTSAAPPSGDARVPSETLVAKTRYEWTQTTDEVHLSVWLGPVVTRADLRVCVEPNRLSVSARGQTLLSGALAKGVRSRDAVWTIDAGPPRQLQLLLPKAAEHTWSRLFPSEEPLHPALAIKQVCEDSERYQGSYLDLSPEARHLVDVHRNHRHAVATGKHEWAAELAEEMQMMRFKWGSENV